MIGYWTADQRRSIPRICVDTGRGCSLLLTSPLAASQNFEVQLPLLATLFSSNRYISSTKCPTFSTSRLKYDNGLLDLLN